MRIYSEVGIENAKYRKNTSFNGMTKALKNRIYLDGQKDIEKLIAKHRATNPEKSLNVGQLPKYIFDKIPQNLRKEAIPEILRTFDAVTTILRDYMDTSFGFCFDETERNRPQFVNDLLTDVFRKYNVIKPEDEIDLRWLGKGGRGKAYKIQGIYDAENEDEYVLKVYHQVKGNNWHHFKSHGCYAELNSAMYWRNQEGMDTHRGKFYFGSLESGYMITKYLDEDTRLPNRIVPEYKYGIKCTDERKYKSKSSYEQDYNYVKDYNFDFGGMRIVNRVKNWNRPARLFMEKVKKCPAETRQQFWNLQMADINKGENKIAGLALSIKHLQDKTKCIDKCLEYNYPKVWRALSYVLKYLNEDDAKKYFEILMKKNDTITQVILLNEIPLLSRKKDLEKEIQDDITATLGDIQTELIYYYYKVAEKYAKPDAIEHLASFVHLLPKRVMKKQYTKLTNINNNALLERLIYKMSMLPDDLKDYAIFKLAQKLDGNNFREDIINLARFADPRVKEAINKKYGLV